MKKVLCCFALAAALVPFVGRLATAQDTKATPIPSLDWIIATRPVPGTLTVQVNTLPPTPPAYCNPCLFYGGDFNANAATANGLANENTLLVPDTTLYIPFDVSSTWTVTGLFTNDLADGFNGIDPAQATWSISTGMSQGNAGTVVASGTASATFNATGRNGFGFNEYTTLVNLSTAVTLNPGRYWLSVVPQCTNSGDSNCDVAQYFTTNTTSFTNHVGRYEPVGRSLFNSSYFGFNYGNACTVTTDGCRAFSAGVLGTSN